MLQKQRAIATDSCKIARMDERFTNDPEFHALLRCANACVGSDEVAWTPAENLDWNRLLDLAILHKVMPLLHGGLTKLRPESAPKGFKREIHKRYLTNVARNEFMAKELIRVLDTLESNKIRTLPVKGPALAMLAYGELSARMFDDLDLLLRAKDIDRARATLVADGYEPLVELSDVERKAHIEAGWGCSMRSPGKDYYVELDSAVTPEYFSFHMRPAVLWENTAAILLGDRQFHTVSIENLLIILCVHGTKHLWHRLAWICDIGQLIRTRTDIHWRRVLVRAKTLGGLRMVLMGLELCRQVLEIKLPGEVVKAIDADPAVGRLAQQAIEEHLLVPDKKVKRSAELRFHLAARERVADKVRHCLFLALTPSYSDWNSVKLPKALFILHYVIRPFRLAWKLFPN
jgi:hypothetical protein